MKKLIRIILKIPATPFVVSFFVIMIFATFVCEFFEWVYEASEWDKDVTREMRRDYIISLKKWFTTI